MTNLWISVAYNSPRPTSTLQIPSNTCRFVSGQHSPLPLPRAGSHRLWNPRSGQTWCWWCCCCNFATWKLSDIKHLHSYICIIVRFDVIQPTAIKWLCEVALQTCQSLLLATSLQCIVRPSIFLSLQKLATKDRIGLSINPVAVLWESKALQTHSELAAKHQSNNLQFLSVHPPDTSRLQALYLHHSLSAILEIIPTSFY